MFPVDILAVASRICFDTEQSFIAGMMMNNSQAAVEYLDRARAAMEIAARDREKVFQVIRELGAA